jgi:hypothetical protein
MSDYFFNIYSIPYLISFFISLAIAGILLLKKRNDSQVQMFIISMIFTAGLSITAAMERNSLNRYHGEIWISLNYLFSILAVTTLYHVSYIYLHKKQPLEDKKILYLYIIPFFFLTYIIIANLPSIKNEYSALGMYARSYTAPYSYFYPLFYTSTASFVLLMTYNFIRMHRQSKDPGERLQASYFILSLLIIFIGIVIAALLVFYSIQIEWEITMIFLSAGLIIITVGILKHGFFDVEFVVKKTFIYTLLILPLVGAFRLIELILSYFVSFTFFAGDLMARLIAAAIVAGCFFPLRTLSVKMGDKIFPMLTQTIKIDKVKDMMVYRTQLEHALTDGKLSKQEIGMLMALREDLGITKEEHDRIQKETLIKLGKKKH